MKKLNYLLFVVLISIVMFSCNTNTNKENAELKAKVAELKKQNAEFVGETYTMSAEIGEYRSMLAEIENNVAAYDAKNHTVKSIMTSDNNDEDVEEDILLHIEHMHGLLENSKHKAIYLDENVKKLRQIDNADEERIHQLETELRNLSHAIIARDRKITELHKIVAVEGIDIALLSEAYYEQAVYNEVLFEIIYTAFFAVGTKSELKEYGILDVKGGFIGIGRVKALSDNASFKFMTVIDIDKTDMIEFEGKKANLITPHPKESYTITYDNKTNITILGISNKLKFWQETNYLIVEIKK